MSIAPPRAGTVLSMAGGGPYGHHSNTTTAATIAARARAPINFGSSIALSPADLTDLSFGFITSSGPADPRLYIRPSNTLVEQLGFESNVFIILTPVQVRQHLALEKQQQRKFLAVTGAPTLGNEFGLDQDDGNNGNELVAMGRRGGGAVGSSGGVVAVGGSGSGAIATDPSGLIPMGGTGGGPSSSAAFGHRGAGSPIGSSAVGSVDDANAIGQPVTYGSKFCLMHKQSGMLVALLSTQPSAIDNNCFVISLVPSFETSSSAHFKFAPRYKFHSDGDTVYSGDQIVMQLFNRPVFMHLSRAVGYSYEERAPHTAATTHQQLNSNGNRRRGNSQHMNSNANAAGLLGVPPMHPSRASSVMGGSSGDSGGISRTSSYAPANFRQDEVNGSEQSTSWVVTRYDIAADDAAYTKATAKAGRLGLLTGTPLAFFHREMEMVVTTMDLFTASAEGGLDGHGGGKEDHHYSPVLVAGRETFGAGDTLKPPQRPFGGNSNSRSVSRMGDSMMSVTPKSPHLQPIFGGGGASDSANPMTAPSSPLANYPGGSTAIVLGEAGLSSEDFNFLTLQCRCTAMWILEASDPTHGGPVRTRLRYRIRQAATNKYLSVSLASTGLAEFGAEQTAQPQLVLVPQPKTEEELSRSLFAVSLAVDTDGGSQGGFVTQSDFLRIQHVETGSWLGTTRVGGGSTAGGGGAGGASSPASPPNNEVNVGGSTPDTVGIGGGAAETAAGGSGGSANSGSGGIAFVTLMPRWQPHDALLAGHVIGHLQRSVLHLYRFAEILERCRDYFAKTRSQDLRGPHVQNVLRGATDALVALISFCSDSENDNALEREGLPIRHHQQMLFDLHLHRLLIEVVVAPFIGKVDHLPELDLHGGAFDMKGLRSTDKSEWEPLFDLLRLCIRLLKQMIKGAPDLAARISDYIPLMYAFEGLKLHVADTVIEFFGNNQLLPYDLKTASIEHYVGILASRRSGGYLRILSALATDSFYRSMICEQLTVRNPTILTRLEMVGGDLFVGVGGPSGNGKMPFNKFLQQPDTKHVKPFEAQIELFSQMTQGSTQFVVDIVQPFLPQEQCEWILQNVLWGDDDSVLSLNKLDVTRAHFIDIALNLHVLPTLRTPFIQLRAGVPLLASSKLRHSNPTHSGVADTGLIKTLKSVCKHILKMNPFQVMENRRRNTLLKSCVLAWKRLIEHWQYTEEELVEVLPMLIDVLDGFEDAKTIKRAAMRSDMLQAASSGGAQGGGAGAPANSHHHHHHAMGWNRHKLTEDGILAFQVKEAAIETLHLLLDNMAHVKSNHIIARASVATTPADLFDERLGLIEEANEEIIEKFDTPRLLRLLLDIARYEMQSLSRKALDLIAHLGFVRQMVHDKVSSLPATRDRSITMYFDECFSAAESLVSQVNQLAVGMTNSAAAGGGFGSSSASPFGVSSTTQGPPTPSGGDYQQQANTRVSPSPGEYYAVRRRAISEGPQDSSMFPATPRGRSFEAAAAVGNAILRGNIAAVGGNGLGSTTSTAIAGSPTSQRPRSISDIYGGAGGNLLKTTVNRVMDLMDKGCGADHSQALAATMISHWGIHLTLLRLLTRMPIDDPIYPLIIRFFQRFTQVEENARKLLKYTDVFLAGVSHDTAHSDCLRIIVAIMTSNATASGSSGRASLDLSLVSKIEQMIVAELDKEEPDGSLLSMINRSCAAETLPFKFLRELVEGLHQRNAFRIVREAHSKWSLVKLHFVADLLGLLNHYACHSAQTRNAVNKIITPGNIIRVLLQKSTMASNTPTPHPQGSSGANSNGGGGGSLGITDLLTSSSPLRSNDHHFGSHYNMYSNNNNLHHHNSNNGHFGGGNAPRPLPLVAQGPLFRLLTALWSFEDESSYEMQRIRTQWTNSGDWWQLLSSIRETIARVTSGDVGSVSSSGGDGQITVDKFITAEVVPAVTMFYRNCMLVALASRKQELGTVTRDVCTAIRDAVTNRPSVFATNSVLEFAQILSDICEQMDMKTVSKHLIEAKHFIVQERRAAEQARRLIETSHGALSAAHHRLLMATVDEDDGGGRGGGRGYHHHHGHGTHMGARMALPESLEKCCVTQEPIISFVRMLQKSQLNPSHHGNDFVVKTMTLLKRGELSMVTTVSLVKIFRQALTDCSEEEMIRLQDNLDSLGLMRVSTALSESKNDTVLEAAYRLGIALLEGGNTKVQNRMLEYFETHDEKFFANVRQTIDRCKQTVIEFRKKGSSSAAFMGGGGGSNSSSGAGSGGGNSNGSGSNNGGGFSSRKSDQIDTVLKLTRLAFRFLQLLCEGHHLGMQNYMRDQLDNLHSINMVSEVALLMRELCAATDTGTTVVTVAMEKARREAAAKALLAMQQQQQLQRTSSSTPQPSSSHVSRRGSSATGKEAAAAAEAAASAHANISNAMSPFESPSSPSNTLGGGGMNSTGGSLKPTLSSLGQTLVGGGEDDHDDDADGPHKRDSDAGRDARFKTQCLMRLLPVINGGFALLTEVCQGPCPANQAALLSHGISFMITHGFGVLPSDKQLFEASGGDGDDSDEDSGSDSDDDGDGDEKADEEDDDDDDEENLTPPELLVQLRARASTTLLAILEGCTDARTYATIATQVPLPMITNLLPVVMHKRSQEEVVNQLENDDVTETVFNLLIFLIQINPYSSDKGAIANILFEYQHLAKYLGSVEIQREERLENVFFRVPRLCMALSDLTKDILLWSVDRSNRSTKLADFVQQADEIIYGMEVTHAFENKVVAYTRFSLRGSGAGGRHQELGPIAAIHKFLRKSLPGTTGDRLMLAWNRIVPFIFTHKLEYYEKLFLAMAIAVNVSLLVFGKKLDPQEVDAVSDLDSPDVFPEEVATISNSNNKSGAAVSSFVSPPSSLPATGIVTDEPIAFALGQQDSNDGGAPPSFTTDAAIPTAADGGDDNANNAASSSAEEKGRSAGGDENSGGTVDGDNDSQSFLTSEEAAVAAILADHPFTFSAGKTMGIPTWLFSVAGLFQLFFTAAVLLIDTSVLLPTDIYRIKKRRERRNDAKDDGMRGGGGGGGGGAGNSGGGSGGSSSSSSSAMTTTTSANFKQPHGPASSAKLIQRITNSQGWTIATRIQTIYRVMMVLFSLLSFTVSPLFCAAFLIALIHQSSVLMNVIVAITTNGRSLLLTMGLGVVMVYLFAIIGFTTFPSSFGERDEGGEPNCDSFGRCFAFILVHGLRQGGGVGDIMKDMPWSSKGLVPRMGYDFLFFALLNVVFLNILFGIIIDAFAELRDDKRTKEEDMHGTCYICGTQAEEFEKHGVSFLWHVRREHNMWQYLYLMYHLRTKDPNEYTGQESYVHKLLNNNSLAFFPEETSLALQEKLLRLQLASAASDAAEGADNSNGGNSHSSDGADGGGGGSGGADDKEISLITQLIAAMQEANNGGGGSSALSPVGLADLRNELAASKSVRLGGGGGGGSGANNNGVVGMSGGGSSHDLLSNADDDRHSQAPHRQTMTMTMLTNELAASHRLCERLHIGLAEANGQVRRLERQVRKHEATITALTDFFQKDIPVVWHDALREIIEAREGKKLTNVAPVEFIETRRKEIEEEKQRRREARAARGEGGTSMAVSSPPRHSSPTGRSKQQQQQQQQQRDGTSKSPQRSRVRDHSASRRGEEAATSSKITSSKGVAAASANSRAATPTTKKSGGIAAAVATTPGPTAAAAAAAAAVPFVPTSPNASLAAVAMAANSAIPIIAVTNDETSPTGMMMMGGGGGVMGQQRRRRSSVDRSAASAATAAAAAGIPQHMSPTQKLPTMLGGRGFSKNNHRDDDDGNHSSSSSSHRSHMSMMDMDLDDLDDFGGGGAGGGHGNHRRSAAAAASREKRREGRASPTFLSAGRR